MKVISKADILKKKFLTNIKNEKKIMETVNNVFVVRTEYCFTSKNYIFFVMKFK